MNVYQEDPDVFCLHTQNRFTRFHTRRPSNGYKTIGNYKIGAKLGQGSHGYVYRAYQLSENKKYAVKILPNSQINAQKLHNEVKILETVKHQNIIKIKQVINKGDRIFIFMQLCEKGDIFQVIKSNGQMAEPKAGEIFIKIYSAIMYLHRKGITHRDIKAQNILLDQNMNPKLIDFGLARFYQTSQPFLEQFCGSLNYVAPEIIRKKRYRPELIDLWSLCVVLYVMLTGLEPFNLQNDKRLMRVRILNYQWKKNAKLSKQAVQLMDAVFVSPQHRIKLQDVKKFSFFKKYQQFYNQPNENLTQATELQKFVDKQLQIQKDTIIKNENALEQQKYIKRRQKSRQHLNKQNGCCHRSENIGHEGKHSKIQFVKLAKIFRQEKSAKSVQHSDKFRIRKRSLVKNIQLLYEF